MSGNHNMDTINKNLQDLNELEHTESLIQSDLRKELEMYKRIVDHMWESIWIWDENERTVYSNPNFCKLMWYTLDEMKWRESYDFRDEESSKTVAANNEKRQEWDASKYEWVLKAKDGTLVPVLCSWTPIPWGWTVWIMTDLREVKSLQEVEENLKQINKTKDEFISIVWHELRTPLTAIRWYVSMMIDWDMWDINWPQKSALDHIYSSTVRLIDLVNDMLSVSKIESWRMEYYMADKAIWPIIDSIYKDIKTEWERRGLNMILEMDNNVRDINVHVDENKLKQAILNILTNAIKFTPKWGSVTLISKLVDNKVYIWIKDTWEWIPADKIPTLFWKFTQVESALQRQNTAWLWLWLSLVKTFIEKFGSKVKIESEVWKGSLFYFYLDKVN